MWHKRIYEFKATDSTFIDIRGILSKNERKDMIPKKEGDLCPTYNYSRDFHTSFIESPNGDYFLASGLMIEKPGVYSGGTEFNRFVEVISTDKGLVDCVLEDLKRVVEEQKQTIT